MTKKLSLIKYIAFATIVLSAGCGGSNPVSNKEEKTLVLPKPPAMSLIDVSAAGDLESVKKHIAAGTDVNQLDPDEQGDKDSCLGVAAAFEHKNVVLALIEAGADIGYRNKNGSTPLHIAAFFCYPEITQTLVEKGADKNVLDNEGGTALDGVLLPWNQAKSIYEAMNSIFTPLGAPLDYDRIKSTRPEIVDILQK